jgi:hypothetical protein
MNVYYVRLSLTQTETYESSLNVEATSEEETLRAVEDALPKLHIPPHDWMEVQSPNNVQTYRVEYVDEEEEQECEYRVVEGKLVAVK